MLDLLSLYAIMAVYPTDYEEQSGEFICYQDSKGRFCPVGFLVERTAGRALADSLCGVASEKELDPLQLAAFKAWLYASGLSRNELRMIHPHFSNTNTIASGGLPATSGLSQAFADLQMATRTRNSDFYATALAGSSSLASSDFPDTEKPGEMLVDEDSSESTFGSMFDLVQNGEKPRLRVFFISNQLGEPVLAITFSRSF